MRIWRLRGGMYAGCAALLCLTATGCRHRQTAVLPIPPPQIVPVETTAKTDSQALVQPVPMTPVPLTSVIAVKKKVKKPKRIPVVIAPAVPVPVQVASSPEPNLIGALTAGGTDAPQNKREAQDLIGALERRVNALPQAIKDSLRLQLLQVRNFQKAAETSLNAGDAEGALTLATKAKLLLDDLVK